MHGMSSVPKLPAELPSLGISLSRASGFSGPPPWNSKASVQKGHGDRRRRRELAQQAADPRLTMRLVGALGAGSASSTSGSNSRTLGSPVPTRCFEREQHRDPNWLSNLSGDAWAAGTRSNQRPSRLTASVVACKLLIHSRAAAAARNGALSAQGMSTCGVGRYAFSSVCVV